MRKDKSPRTKMTKKYSTAFKMLTVGVIFAVVFLVQGITQFNDMIAHSSSPIGTNMTFNRSNASVSMSGIYTDINKDVLIVRLSSNSNDALKLPYKGTDYKVYISSTSLNGYTNQEVPILFGRYSTNGDLFLVIPKPSESVYNVFIMNKNFIATNDLASTATRNTSAETSTSAANSGSGYTNTSSKSLNEDEIRAQLTKSMNGYKYTDNPRDNKSIKVDSDLMDVIGFKVTLNPAINDDSYRPQVIKENLLDENNNFDFEKFFNSVFKSAAENSIDSQYEDLNNQKKLLDQRVEELTQRIKDNPTDSDAKTLLNQVQSNLNTIDSSLESLATQYQDYNNVSFDPNTFKNLQTNATVLNSDTASKLIGNTSKNK